MQTNRIFEHPEFGKVRTVMIDGEPWFVAADVCKALSISNSRDSVGKLDNDEKMTVDLTDSHSGTRGGAQKISVVNEPGLYTLVLSSRKPEAKSFPAPRAENKLPGLTDCDIKR